MRRGGATVGDGDREEGPDRWKLTPAQLGANVCYADEAAARCICANGRFELATPNHAIYRA
jgi:hypothetical protein